MICMTWETGGKRLPETQQLETARWYVRLVHKWELGESLIAETGCDEALRLIQSNVHSNPKSPINTISEEGVDGLYLR